ncbi:hypothetical protein EDC03_1457 [Pseudokineococcus lusitanus]|uniref:DUF2007 domain-containing protein n=1 Tax=Pseudokineococcus lusitanus TaxID=763993 RepID=A0A3N1HN11_9ACTN|nr:hypothetical protein EDC03_1457 [Pseudokineococcus lusitanus]
MTGATSAAPAAPSGGPRAAARPSGAHTARVDVWAAYQVLFGPLMAFVAVGVLALLLRWTWARGRSLVPGRARQGAPEDYGLLVAVAEPATFVEAEVLRRRLEDEGLRATLAPTTEGPRVLVFPRDAEVARAVLRRP